MMRIAIVLAGLCLALPRPGLAVERANCAAARASVQAQLASECPCATAKSHAEHVRCVSDKLRKLSACRRDADGKQTCGPFPRTCIGELRRTASHSACGNRSLVTCCVPRQYDCSDAALGDGKKDGTCSGTTKPCDTLADCKLPKCQTDASAERCTLRGGTVGRGQDCNTACAP